IYAMTEDRCVGSVSPMAMAGGAKALAMTVWHNDELSSEINGLLTDESFRVIAKRNGQQFPLVYSMVYEEDGITPMIKAVFDTTTAARVDSLISDIITLEMVIDSTFVATSATISNLQSANDGLTLENQQLQVAYDTQLARADSLQGLVDNFPDIADLQNRLDSANDRIVELESDFAQANVGLINALGVIRQAIIRIRSR
ncbi:hypothetical protein LCGC14_1723900, partial [marine sediment metagenome]